MAKIDSGVVMIHGKEYKTVALRIQQFREQFKDHSIESEVLCAADIVSVKSTIKDEQGRVIATGLAEEKRDSTNILTTSALETCETSAVGRALAFLGLGGTEIASADELVEVLKKVNQGCIDHMVAVRDHMTSILVVIDGINKGDLGVAAEAWFELSEDERMTLWVATSKGGVFTTEERQMMKTTEFKEAYFGTTT